MRAMIVVLANLFVAVVAVLAVNECFALRRYRSFAVPFTDKLVTRGIVKAADRDRVLKEEKTLHAVGLGLALAMWALLGLFIAGIAAVPVFAVVAGGLALASRPEGGETPANRAAYERAHRKDMDVVKYHAYLVEVGDARD